ncbi:hypothetical protein LTR62_001853 [Meristemomyces frigidus]|uniref:RNA polymerase II holoenzyme cyclin-like subunit n=1 Tax=Meristemomyces frigidus TaxID=1508187 RepID=A0AAN7TFH1_9PEZI|nr:hypothetical protein LTR62_001853 [Meristemomyces frigidus]
MPPIFKAEHLSSSHPEHRQRGKEPDRILAEAEAQWLFTEAELANTPSIQDGMPLAEERDTRAKGVHFVVQVGIMLKLPQLTLSIAAIYFQRFLMRASLKKPRGDIPKLHHYQIAATALFLATKVEESCRKMKDMILAFCRVAQKNPNLVIDEQSKDFWRWKDSVLHNEDVMLETLCFDLTVESPHRQLFVMLQSLRVEHNKRLRNAAWAFVTDSSNTQLCLLCSTRTIAVAGFYAGCRYSDVKLPDDKHGRPWWEGQGVTLSEIRRAVEYMCANYEQAAGEVNGGAGHGREGESSVYAGLSTPAESAGNGESWDSTRLQEERPVSSPFVLPVGSDRRASHGSEAGEKRRRDEQHASSASHGKVDNNGVEQNDQHDSKRPKLNEPATNSKFTSEADPKVEEERLRVEQGNASAVADMEATKDAHSNEPGAKVMGSISKEHESKTEAEVEEGEVEE